jgi:hypothetical protein
VRICCRRDVYDRIDIEMALGCCAYENGEDIMRDGGYSGDEKLHGLMDPKSQKQGMNQKYQNSSWACRSVIYAT